MILKGKSMSLGLKFKTGFILALLILYWVVRMILASVWVSNLNGKRGRSLIAAHRFQPAKSACWNATCKVYGNKSSDNKIDFTTNKKIDFTTKMNNVYIDEQVW